MNKQRKYLGLVASAGLIASLAGGMITLTTASADPTVSTLQANPTSVSGNVGDAATPVTVALDSGCSNAFKVGQSYSITAVSADSSIATVTPDVSGALHCGGDKGPTSATFNVTGACPGTTHITFTPVAGPKGLQNKLAGTSVNVTFTDTGALCGSGGVTGTGGDNPAAPAVANAYLNANPDAAAACKAHFGGAKSWRGSTISAVAAVMPKPESIKDTMDAATWVNQVVNTMLDPVCGIPVV